MSKPSVLKGCLESLVALEKTKRIPKKPSCDASPLISNFENWSGKPRKLYLRDARSMKRQGLPYELNSNMFAQLLASPMRLDKITRVRAPKELLVQIKLRKADTDISAARGKPFELRPSFGMERGHPTSYVSNSVALVHKYASSAMKWLPSSANSTIRHINQADVATQPEWYSQAYTEQMLGSLREALSSTLMHLGKAPESDPRDVIIVCNPQLPAISLRKSENTFIALATTVFNLYPIKDPELEKVVNNRDIELCSSKHRSLCFLIYRLLAFQADRII